MELLVAMLRRAEIPAANSTTIRLEAKPIDMITRADVEAVRVWRRQELTAGKSRPGVKGGEAGINRLLSRLRHLFSWAIAEGYLTETPFKRGPVNVVKLEMSVEGARTRRLAPSITRPDGSVQDGKRLAYSRTPGHNCGRSLWRRFRQGAGSASYCRCNGRRSAATSRDGPAGSCCQHPRLKPVRLA